MENYQKDFDGWNRIKKKLNASEYEFMFHNGEIWWCSVGVNIGSEQDGKGELFRRPVLVFSKINGHLFYGIPFTRTRQRNENWTEEVIVDGETTYALLNQIERYSAKRLNEPIGLVSEKIFYNIVDKVREYPMNPNYRGKPRKKCAPPN